VSPQNEEDLITFDANPKEYTYHMVPTTQKEVLTNLDIAFHYFSVQAKGWKSMVFMV
jgi:hypothetical protein